ncbi:hypothetical protein [Flavobacterium filum]|uniref:hypothetical protein n=1 Tax=Flavobacterium filum TaxID=370974 RepID=UPI0023EFA006|nr:hypothetical protein [Flavobacterium filum]
MSVHQTNIQAFSIYMKILYPFAHWLLTVLLSPLMSNLLFCMVYQSPLRLTTFFELYPATIIFIFIFSTPTFLCYLVLFFLLKKYPLPILVAKLCLNATAIIGILITWFYVDLFSGYHQLAGIIISTLLIGFLLKLEKNPANSAHTED